MERKDESLRAKATLIVEECIAVKLRLLTPGGDENLQPGAAPVRPDRQPNEYSCGGVLLR